MLFVKERIRKKYLKICKNEYKNYFNRYINEIIKFYFFLWYNFRLFYSTDILYKAVFDYDYIYNICCLETSCSKD